MNINISPEDLVKRFNLEGHPENGLFKEVHYEDNINERPSSGSIYYYLEKDVLAKFHKIDCDEYWIYVSGEDLQLWLIDEKGQIEIKRLGVKEGSQPMIYIKKGIIFGSKHDKEAKNGTFIVCITVPRFSYKGFELYEDEEIKQKYPGTEEFFKK